MRGRQCAETRSGVHDGRRRRVKRRRTRRVRVRREKKGKWYKWG
jgi:hypothetical protein